MAQCPYSEKMRDEDTGRLLDNPVYEIWHEGYEACKLEHSRTLPLKVRRLIRWPTSFVG